MCVDGTGREYVIVNSFPICRQTSSEASRRTGKFSLTRVAMSPLVASAKRRLSPGNLENPLCAYRLSCGCHRTPMRLPALLAVATDGSARPETTMYRTQVIYASFVSKDSAAACEFPFYQNIVLASSSPLRVPTFVDTDYICSPYHCSTPFLESDLLVLAPDPSDSVLLIGTTIARCKLQSESQL